MKNSQKIQKLDINNLLNMSLGELSDLISEAEMQALNCENVIKKKSRKKKGNVSPTLPPGLSFKPEEDSIKKQSEGCCPYLEVPTSIVVDPAFKDEQGCTIDWTPSYETKGAACADLRVMVPPDISEKREVSIPYRSCLLLDCGFSMQLPSAFKAEITVRSGLAAKGMVIINSPAQIDEDYRGRIKVVVGNVGKEILKIKHGDRIGQIFPVPVYRFKWNHVEKLDETERGDGGFGHTGVN